MPARRKPADDLAYQRKLVDLKIEHASAVYGHAASHDNVMVLAGYAAFFGLLASVGQDVSQFCRLVTVALMAISLLSYVIFHIWQMIIRQGFEHERSDVFQLADDPARFHAALEDVNRRQNASFGPAMKVWRVMFPITVGTGILSAFTLAWNAVATAMGLPLELLGPGS